MASPDLLEERAGAAPPRGSSDSDRPTGPKRYERSYVRSLFDRIAARYDLLNHILSSGLDIYWRRRAVGMLQGLRPRRILDVATGTGDQAIAAARLKPAQIIGVDISPEMLKLAREKIARRRLGTVVSVKEGAAEELQFPDGSFDAVTIAFGVRNFADLERGLAEMRRVLRSGGVAVILEFSRPQRTPFKHLYGFYLRRVLPRVGGFISKSREAYEYLPSTVELFPDGEDFERLLRSVGFGKTSRIPLTFGVVTIYAALKE